MLTIVPTNATSLGGTPSVQWSEGLQGKIRYMSRSALLGNARTADCHTGESKGWGIMADSIGELRHITASDMVLIER